MFFTLKFINSGLAKELEKSVKIKTDVKFKRKKYCIENNNFDKIQQKIYSFEFF